jgi:peptide chain release factor 2
MRERTQLEDQIGSLTSLERELDDAVTLVELGEAEDDAATEQEGVASLKALLKEAQRRQTEALFSGEADANDTYIEVHSGAGGTESCDWARMLFRMYARWGERHKFKVEVIEETAGDEAGIKSGTVLIKGHNALRLECATPYQLRVGLGISSGG